MKRQIVFIMAVIALILIHGVHASEQPRDANAPVELEDYLAFAAMNNAGLKVAFEQWKIAVEQVFQPVLLRPNSGFDFLDEISIGEFRVRQ